MNKKALEMSFAWIFGLLVGGIILAFAIYFASQLIENEQYGVNTKTARDFANLFEPLQTVVGEKSITTRTMVTETRVYASCDSSQDFGESIIQLSEESGFGEEFTKPGGEIKIKNHYIFAEDIIEGKEFYFFTVPIEMPFKIADLMIVYSGNYCFVDAPEELKNFIDNLENNTNLFVVESASKCEKGKKVCFGGADTCEINVNCYEPACESGNVKIGRKEIIFTGGLLYGAIFSSPENYECNVKRIMNRSSLLSGIYREKAIFISGKGCNTGLEEDMTYIGDLERNYKKTQDLIEIAQKSKEIGERNRELQCPLF